MIYPNQIQAFETPGAAWRWACDMIKYHGQKVITEDGQTTREIRNLVMQVSNPHVGWPIAESGWDIPALDVYVRDQIFGTANPTGFSYIYGQRIAPRLPALIEKLKAQPESRRAVISLWQDSDYDIQHPPCWMVLEFLVRGDLLHLTAFIRSWDVKQAAPANMYGMSKLLDHVSRCVGAGVGSLTVMAVSAHVYDR